MYLYPIFLDCINFSNLYAIVCKHMNNAAVESINHLIEIIRRKKHEF